MTTTETKEHDISTDDNSNPLQRLAAVIEERDALQRELATLRTQRNEAVVLRDDLQIQFDDTRTELRRVENQAWTARQELNSFKQQVIEVAARYMERHNLCEEGMSEALQELGLELPLAGYQATLQISVQFHARLSKHRIELPEEDWVEQSLHRRGLEQAIHDAFSMDSDHDSSEIDEIGFEVIGVSEFDE